MKSPQPLSPYGKAVFRLVTAAAAVTMALAIFGLAHPRDVALAGCCLWCVLWLMLEMAWHHSEDASDDDDDIASRW